MNESIHSDNLSDFSNDSLNLSQSPLSLVACDLRPIEGLARSNELRLAGRNVVRHGSSRAGGMMGDIIRARSLGITPTIRTVSSGDHTVARPAIAPGVARTAAGPAVARTPAGPAVTRTPAGPTVARAYNQWITRPAHLT